VQFAVPIEDADKIKPGQKVELKIDGTNQTVFAKVEKIDPAQEPPVNFAVVLADIDDSKLRPDEVRVTSTGRVRIADQIADARGAKR
jgi:HlyD family secretion protein